MSQEQQTQEPTVITLDDQNTVQILAQYIEVAQQKGAFKLNEADILKRGVDVLLNSATDNEINAISAKHLLVQGIFKGQAHGAYTLNDAALLHKVVQYITLRLQQQEQESLQPSQQVQPVQQAQQVEKDEFDDLSDLAEPIPLKPKEI